MQLLITVFISVLVSALAAEELTTAIPVELEAKCKMPVDEGNGDGEIEERFFFDEPTQTCKSFNYTGAGGNENNFFSELECLNDCFIGVVNDHTKDQTEEDVVLLSQNATQPLIDAAVEEWPCTKPKHNGEGKEDQQKFYYDDAYKTCFAFRYKGSGGNNNRFDSHSDCMGTCALADGSVCSGPEPSVEPLKKLAAECADDVCPKNYHCARGLMVECCHKPQYDAVAAAFSETCPDGSAAGGVHVDYFQATFARSCDDLICGKGEKCVQVSKDFAKCCGAAGRRLADEVAVHVRLEDCDTTEKKAITECEKFLAKIDIAQKLDSKTASKSMISSVANLLKEFNSACSLFDEYKTCMSLVTKNAGCLDPTFAVKEQILNFVCQENVKTAMVGDEGACVEKVADSKKVKDCEDGMDGHEGICETLDYTLNCTMPEITTCGSNTLSFITRVVKTIKDAEDCHDSGSDSGGNESAESKPESTVTITTEIETTFNSPPQNEPRKSRRGLRSRNKASRPSVQTSGSCPSYIPTQTTSICLPLFTSRSVKNALSGTPGSFVFTQIVAQNIRPFCSQGKTYRKCVERIYTSIDACTEKLKEDAFYSFIVAIYDHLCEDSKQLDFLINAGCLNEVTSKSSVQRCLLRNSFGDGRTLCKTYQQFDNCLLDAIGTTCRSAEVKYFDDLFDLLTVRQHLCSKSAPSIERPPPDVDDDENEDDTESYDNDDGPSESQRKPSVSKRLPGLNSDCNLRRQLALIRGSSFVPKCEDDGRYSLMQCDRKSGTCFCVDTETGEVTPGSVTGPGKPLPLCGLQSLFTCERLPEKIFCEIDVTLSQKTERWYRRGNRCVKYLFDYCPSTAHLAPIPLRSLNDCKRFCLPSN